MSIYKGKKLISSNGVTTVNLTPEGGGITNLKTINNESLIGEGNINIYPFQSKPDIILEFKVRSNNSVIQISNYTLSDLSDDKVIGVILNTETGVRYATILFLGYVIASEGPQINALYLTSDFLFNSDFIQSEDIILYRNVEWIGIINDKLSGYLHFETYSKKINNTEDTQIAYAVIPKGSLGFSKILTTGNSDYIEYQLNFYISPTKLTDSIKKVNTMISVDVQIEGISNDPISFIYTRNTSKSLGIIDDESFMETDVMTNSFSRLFSKQDLMTTQMQYSHCGLNTIYELNDDLINYLGTNLSSSISYNTSVIDIDEILNIATTRYTDIDFSEHTIYVEFYPFINNKVQYNLEDYWNLVYADPDKLHFE